MTTIQSAFDRLLALLAGAGAAVFALTALLIPVNVVLRACCRTSLFGLLDAVEYGLLATTFLAAPWVLARNAHVTVDIATIGLPARPRRMLDLVVNSLGALLSAVLAWYALAALLISHGRGSVILTAFAMPEWIPLLAPTVGGALLAVEFVRRAVRGPAAATRAATGL